MSGKTNVSSHVRSGRPVKAYTQTRPATPLSERIGEVLAGHRKGNAKLAMLGAGLIGAMTVAWYVFSFIWTVEEAAFIVIVTSIAALGLTAGARHRRKGRKPASITFSPRARLAHLRRSPRIKYRRFVQRARKQHPVATGVYDRWFGVYECTEKHKVMGKNGRPKTQARTVKVRGLKARQEKETQAENNGWHFSVRQRFR